MMKLNEILFFLYASDSVSPLSMLQNCCLLAPSLPAITNCIPRCQWDQYCISYSRHPSSLDGDAGGKYLNTHPTTHSDVYNRNILE